jgi:alkylhydroperoxidase family enzyme
MRKTWQALAVFGAVAGVAASVPQGPAVNTLMREKLRHSQQILEAVVTSNWTKLESESRNLADLTKDPRWTVFKYPEYARHSLTFVQAVDDLRLAAAQRDLEKTPAAYTNMTLQCVACHRYLARARIVGENEPR